MSSDVDPLDSDSLGMTIVQSLTAQLDGTVTFDNRKDSSGLRVVVHIRRAYT
jgi:two-component sensor histidine kinase